MEAARFTNARENNPNSKQLEKDIRSNSNKTDGILIKKILDSPYLSDLMKVKPEFGAFEIYRQYRENPTQTLNNLIAAMKLGNTCSIQETYQVAGVQFDFSDAAVKKMADFLRTEYNSLFEQLKF